MKIEAFTVALIMAGAQAVNLQARTQWGFSMPAALPSLGSLTAGVTADSVMNNLNGQDLIGQAAGI